MYISIVKLKKVNISLINNIYLLLLFNTLLKGYVDGKYCILTEKMECILGIENIVFLYFVFS
jgi:hypothetical protein